MEMNAVSPAIDDFLKAAEINPDDEQNFKLLSQLLYESERFNELIKREETICRARITHTHLLSKLYPLS